LGSDLDGEAGGDWSGTSVSLSADGSRLAVGAIGNDGNGFESGHVRIYRWHGGAWVQMGADIDGETAGDESGWSLALSANGTRVAIGAKKNDGAGSDAGHVRVFEWDGSAWGQVGSDINGEAAGDESGHAISLSADGNRLAIGSEMNNVNGFAAGHVRIFEWDGSAWTQLGASLNGFGFLENAGGSVSLSADGTCIAIGATQFMAGPGFSGKVRVFRWDGNSWEQIGTDITGEASLDLSGWSVSLSGHGHRVAMGAPLNDGNGQDAGHVRVYTWSGTAWIQVGEDIDGEQANDWSGCVVRLTADGNRLAIGAWNNDGNGPDAGQVRIYDWNGTAWVQFGEDIDGEASGDWFGSSLSLTPEGNRVAVGGFFNDDNGLDAGHVRVYHLAPEIDLKGGDALVGIAAGDSTADVNDDTDLGSLSICSTTGQTFRLYNTGAGVLSIDSITISHPDFSIIGAPDSVAVGDSASFQVAYAPVEAGTIQAIISIFNNDVDENLYTFAVAGNAIAGGADLIKGQMLNFDGRDGQVSCPDNGMSQAFTLEGWIYLDTTAGNQVFFGQHFGGFIWSNGGSLRFELRNATNTAWRGNPQDGGVAVPLSAQTWYHVAGTFGGAGTSMKLYLDGQLVSETSVIPDNPWNPVEDFYIGSWDNKRFLKGKVEELRVWNRVRTEAEIRENMNQTLHGCESSLLAYYQFNDSTGSSSLSDHSGNGYHGSLVNLDVHSDWEASQLALGQAQTDRINVNGTGMVHFPQTGVSINFADNPKGEIVVSRIQGLPHGHESLGNQVDDEYFVIRNFGSNSNPAVNGITFRDIRGFSPETNPSDLKLYKRSSNAFGPTWGNVLAAASGLSDLPSGTVTYTGSPLFSGFSQFVTSQQTTTFPVEILDFEARLIEHQKVALNWTTGSEKNNDGFEVLHSTDAKNWEKLDFVKGQGNTNQETQYRFVDTNPILGTNYYRLRQIDLDGQYEYSSIVNITLRSHGISLFPNPAKSLVNLSLKSNYAGRATLTIMDVNGRVVESELLELHGHALGVEIDISKIPEGIYTLKVKAGKEQLVEKLVIK
jgi:hypothetical protein